MWPSLTGAETLQLLGRAQGRVDVAYRDELIGRFDMDVSKKVRAYSKGNRQELILVGALMTRADLLDLDGADERTRPSDGTGLPSVRPRSEGPQSNGVPVLAHPERSEALCDRVGDTARRRASGDGDPGQMRHLSALSVEATFEGPVPDLAQVPGVSSLEVTGRVARCQVRGTVEPLLRSAQQASAELLSSEPSLEELFLAHYGAGSGTRDQPGTRPSMEAESAPDTRMPAGGHPTYVVALRTAQKAGARCDMGIPLRAHRVVVGARLRLRL